MREILFRGQRVDNKEWAHGSLVITPNEHYAIVIYNEFGKQMCPVYYEVIPETVGQFTGLKDKNGEEIYERDVCRIYFDVDNVSDYIYFGLSKQEIETQSRIFVVKSPLFNNQEEFCVDVIEVIGNKFDNPELLEEQ